MHQADVINAIANDSGLTKIDAEKALKSFISVVTDSLKKGDKVTLPGFVTISNVARAARTGRNPRTGETIQIAAKNVAKFKVGKTLADALN